MRTLALDVGDARIGVAMSDALGITAQPLFTIERKKESPIERLKILLAESQAGTVVVGIPLMLSGEVGEQAKKVLAFANQLRNECAADDGTVPNIVFWDERLTTAEAERVIQGSKLKDGSRRASLDRVSAALILSAYLESANRSGWHPPPECTT